MATYKGFKVSYTLGKWYGQVTDDIRVQLRNGVYAPNGYIHKYGNIQDEAYAFTEEALVEAAIDLFMEKDREKNEPFKVTEVAENLRDELDEKLVQSLRPDHYEEGFDTFAWAERKFGIDACIIIAQFNIHKYNDREKGQNREDIKKVIDYSQWQLKLMDKKDGLQ